MDATLIPTIQALAGQGRDAIVCSIDDEGFPNAKAMFRAKNEGLRTFWFSTNVSAVRTGQWQKRPQACVYFVNGFHGLMLTGTMEVLTDDATKQAFWHEGDEQYYPGGPTDPDYCILRFTSLHGNYYHGLQKCYFTVAEIEG